MTLDVYRGHRTTIQHNTTKSLPYPSLILKRKRNPFTAGLTEFSSRRMAKPSLERTRYGDFLRYSRAALTTRPRRLSMLLIPGVKKKIVDPLYYGNDQELIQSNPTSHPHDQKGYKNAHYC